MLEVDFQIFFQALDVISLTVDVIFSRHVALIHCGFYFLRDYELEMQLFFTHWYASYYNLLSLQLVGYVLWFPYETSCVSVGRFISFCLFLFQPTL